MAPRPDTACLAGAWAVILKRLFWDGGSDMAKHCEVCGKTPVVGRILSHAHNVRARRFEPNLQRIRAVVNGGIRRIRVCTRCIRSNKVTKAA